MSDRPPELPESPTNITQQKLPPQPSAQPSPQIPMAQPPAMPPQGPDYGPTRTPLYYMLAGGAIVAFCLLFAAIVIGGGSLLSGGDDDDDGSRQIDVATRVPATLAGSQATPTSGIAPTATTATTAVSPTSVALDVPPVVSGPVRAQCDGTVESLLQVGERVQSPTGGGQLYAEPSTSSRVLGTVVAGMVMEVYNGPRCADNATWWYVRYGITFGWVQETAGNAYQLASVEAQLAQLGTIPGRTNPPSGASLLSGGVGLSDGRAMGQGEFQVEWYCNILNFGVATDGNHWVCTVNEVVLAILSPDDLDRICQATYRNVTAVAIQDGSGDVPAYRWRCYGR